MRASLLAIALASVATSLVGQSTVQVRAGVSVFGDDPLRFEEATVAGGVYLDIPHEADAVEGTIHLNVRGFRVGLLWIKHDVAYLDVPAMMLFGSRRVFLAVGGAPGVRGSRIRAHQMDSPCGWLPDGYYVECGNLSFHFSGIAGLGFTAPLPGHPDLSWGMEALFMQEVTQTFNAPVRQLVFTAGIGIR